MVVVGAERGRGGEHERPTHVSRSRSRFDWRRREKEGKGGAREVVKE